MAELKLQVILSAVNNITGPINQALKSAQALNMGIAALGAGIGYSIKEAIKFESVMADVGKVVNFSGAGELKAMGDAILKMSQEIPMAAEGLGEIMAAAGAAGIAKNELIQFTSDAAKMGVAFDMSGKEAGAAMTGMRSIFHLTQKEVVSLGDAFNHLSNNMDAKARDMLNIANRTGSTAKIFGLTGQQLGALSATFLSLKTPPEIAATGINAMLMKLATADKQNAKFQKSLASMGISATGLKNAIKNDAQGALLSFLETVKKAPDQLGTLSDLFGLEYSDDIAKLIGGLDIYKKSLGLVGNSTKYAGSMNREYEIRSKTTANALEILKNKGTALAINIGSLLLPYVVKIADSMGDWVTGIIKLAEKYPAATSAILGAVTALVALQGVLFVGGFFTALIKDVVMVAAAINGVLIRAITSLWTALMFNPFSGVIIIISAAVIGLAALIYKNWYPIKAFLSGLFEGLGITQLFSSIAASPIWQSIASGVSSAISWFRQLFLPIQYTKTQIDSAANAGRNMGAAISGGIMRAITAISNVRNYLINLASNFMSYGMMMMTGLANGISAGLGIVRAKIAAVAASVKSSFTGMLGIHSPSRVFMEYGMNINHGLAAGLQQQQGPLQQINTLAHAVGLNNFDIAGEMSQPSYALPVSNSSSSRVSTQNIHIEVHASAGMNINDLVAQIERKFKQKTNAQLFDGSY